MLNALLEILTDPFGYTAVACVCLSLIGLGMMLVGAARSSAPPIRSAAFLLAPLAYAAAHIAVFLVTISVDPSAIFDVAYILSAGFIVPALMIIALIFVARRCTWLGRLSIVGFAVWTGCVGFAHLWVIAAASASV